MSAALALSNDVPLHTYPLLLLAILEKICGVAAGAPLVLLLLQVSRLFLRLREFCVFVPVECSFLFQRTRWLSLASPPPAAAPPSLSSPLHHLQQPACAQSLINACLTSGNSAAATLAGVFNGLLQRHTSILQVISCIFIFSNCNDARVLKLHAALLENDTTHDIAAEALGDATALTMLRCDGAYVVNFSLDTWETRC